MMTKNGEISDKILIVDGHGLAYRAFYALHNGRSFTPMTAPDGTPTETVMGFMNMLFKAEDEIAPRRCIAAFDSHGPTFRHELLPQYKANRKPSPDEFRQQVPIIQELLRRMGCPVLVAEGGVEADDVMASLALRVAGEGFQAVLLSSDKDLLQVLREPSENPPSGGVTMLRPIRNGISEAELYDTAAFEAEFGFPPVSMPDYLALLGDVSDNVPGVPGIGKGTAPGLIAQWGNLEGLFGALDQVKPAVRKKLEAAGLEAALKSRELIRLKLDVPVDLNACLNHEPDLDGALELASQLALSKVIKRLGGQPRPRAEAPRPDTPRPEKLLLQDYKAELARDPERFATVNPNTVWDLRTAHYLLHPDISATVFRALNGELSEDKLKAPEEIRQYESLRDALKTEGLPALRLQLDAEIDQYEGLRGVMENIDLPLLPVLDRMERWGMRLEPGYFTDLQGELGARVLRIEAEIGEAAGATINLNSPQQVASLLFEKLGFTPEGRTKGKTGWSTSAAVLERLARLPDAEVPRLILEHRELSKMLNGFVIPLQKSAERGGGVIHTTFEAALTGTGRLSSRDPNLQNIPTFGHWAEKIKEGLTPVREGDVFVAADYSQIELRILAHLSQESRLLEAFQRGRDIHSETAAWVFGVEPEFVTPELRRVAKMINFGLLYGMSAFGLAERLDLPRAEASGIVKRYFDALPGVRHFLDGIVSRARSDGYARTLAGRIRPIDEVSASGRPALDRVLINTPIQGTAADIARRAMIDLDRAFASDDEVHPFLQVHDSLVCECPAGRADEVGRILREVMMGAAKLSLPLEVEVKTGGSLALV